MFQDLIHTIRMLAPCVAVSILAVTAPARAGITLDTPEEEAAQDSAREQEVLSIRDGLAVLALGHAPLVPENSTRSVLLYSEKPGLISVDLDAGGSVRGYAGLGFDGDDELDVVIAVQDLLADIGPDAHIADATGFMQDIEAETGSGFMGTADVLVNGPLVDLLVFVDPLGSMQQMMSVFEMALNSGIYGICDTNGYTGEYGNAGGGETNALASGHYNPGSEYGLVGSFFDPLDDTPAPPEDEDPPEDKDQKKEGEDESIAPWSEGPMFVIDQVDTLQVVGPLDALMPVVAQ